MKLRHLLQALVEPLRDQAAPPRERLAPRRGASRRGARVVMTPPCESGDRLSASAIPRGAAVEEEPAHVAAPPGAPRAPGRPERPTSPRRRRAPRPPLQPAPRRAPRPPLPPAPARRPARRRGPARAPRRDAPAGPLARHRRQVHAQLAGQAARGRRRADLVGGLRRQRAARRRGGAQRRGPGRHRGRRVLPRGEDLAEQAVHRTTAPAGASCRARPRRGASTSRLTLSVSSR